MLLIAMKNKHFWLSFLGEGGHKQYGARRKHHTSQRQLSCNIWWSPGIQIQAVWNKNTFWQWQYQGIWAHGSRKFFCSRGKLCIKKTSCSTAVQNIYVYTCSSIRFVGYNIQNYCFTRSRYVVKALSAEVLFCFRRWRLVLYVTDCEAAIVTTKMLFCISP